MSAHDWTSGFRQRNVVEQVDLARYTTLRVGGPAELVMLETTADIPEVLAHDVRWLGRGANLLISDDGVSEPVIKLGEAFADVIIADQPDVEGRTLVSVGAACDLAKCVGHCARAGLAGPEGLAGVPATVGGALCMNAGTAHCWIFDFVSRVQVVLPGTDTAQWLSRDQVPAGYRSSGLPAGTMFLRCELALEPGDPDQLRQRAGQLKRAKAATQPLALRSAGCTFKNPSTELPAGMLVDQLGFKGRRIGDAEVSEVHANFIVNRGQARCADVCQLIAEIRAGAWAERGVDLQLEVETWNCPNYLRQPSAELEASMNQQSPPVANQISTQMNTPSCGVSTSTHSASDNSSHNESGRKGSAHD